MALLPFVMIVAFAAYCWIRKVSPGKVLFTQNRVGLGGKIFKIYKFRSMKPGSLTTPHDEYVAERMRSGKPMPKMDLAGDPRLIRGGFFLRMCGVDELPQLINVLRGEMTLVGPRPCTVNEFAEYRPEQRQRFSVHPGLTGLWQIRRTRLTTFPQMVGYDEEYIARRSPLLDLRILLQTPISVFAQTRASDRRVFAAPGYGPPAGACQKS